MFAVDLLENWLLNKQFIVSTKTIKNFIMPSCQAMDLHVGRRLRARRTLLGMGQDQVGSAIGVTAQQIQKYETGLNRIGAGRLYQLAGLLNIEVSYFFDEVDTSIDDLSLKAVNNPLCEKDTLMIIRSLQNITDPNIRRDLYALVYALANSQPRVSVIRRLLRQLDHHYQRSEGPIS
jgi:transcriptional regulator with XRE-family HTH domain